MPPLTRARLPEPKSTRDISSRDRHAWRWRTEKKKKSRFAFTLPVDGPFFTYTLREPIGVVGAIVPWNFPLNIASWKLGPALACGNTVVLKPAELTPLSALRLAELCLEAGIPEGVVNVLVGKGSVVGQRLIEHPDVAKIAFTGSTEVGRLVMQGAAGTIKRVTLELGGKSANVIFEDADLERAAAAAPYAVFDNAGQDCCARSRILVERRALDRFLALFEAAVGALRVGDPLDEATEMGPLFSAEQRDKVASYVDGETPVAFTGRVPVGPGFWFAPTVLCPVSNDDRVAREEIFGPVLAVIPAKSFDEALSIANGTEYGLTGAVYTRNPEKIERAKREFFVGNLYINRKCTGAIVGAHPFGGFNMSGTDSKAGGRDYLLLFLQAKSIAEKSA